MEISEISVEDEHDESSSSSANVEYKGAHQAFRDRWKQTDDTMCRHSMSFHLHHTLRSEFFASYLYLLEKIPLGKKDHTKVHSQKVKIYDLFLTPDSIKDQAWQTTLAHTKHIAADCYPKLHYTLHFIYICLNVFHAVSNCTPAINITF